MLYLYYEQLEKGGRLIYCQECGKLVLIKNTKAGRPSTYCDKCKKKNELERYKKYNESRV